MPDLTAKRTLVKSPPELWEELSEVDRLAKHLSAFGEITITKLEPEHTVAWEGERASGTVSIEPSGWGTKVTLHAELPEPEQPDPEPEPEPEPEQAPAEPATEAQHVAGPSVPLCVELPAEAPIEEPEVGSQESAVEPEAELEAEPEVEPTRRRGFWGWLFRERTDSPARAVMAAEAEPVAAEPEPSVPEPSEPKPSEPEPSAPEPLESIADEAEPPADEAEPEPEPGPLDAEPAQPDGPVALDPERALVILDEALDTLGAAHHRPFSRG
ncbi:MAG TPA: hypothetical protein VFY47_14535 [Thermoleophilaceae bacterium]|nr:hypothetical protein [Thermoleophilaceae bacterium]